MAVLRNTRTTAVGVVGTSALKPAGSPIPTQRRRRHLILVPGGGAGGRPALPGRSDVVSRPTHPMSKRPAPAESALRLTQRGQRLFRGVAVAVVGMTFVAVIGLLAVSGLLADPAADVVPQVPGAAQPGISDLSGR